MRSVNVTNEVVTKVSSDLVSRNEKKAFQVGLAENKGKCGNYIFALTTQIKSQGSTQTFDIVILIPPITLKVIIPLFHAVTDCLRILCACVLESSK